MTKNPKLSLTSNEAHCLSHDLWVYNAFEVAEKKNTLGGTTITIECGNGPVQIMIPSMEARELIKLCKNHYAKKLSRKGLKITPSVFHPKKAKK